MAAFPYPEQLSCTQVDRARCQEQTAAVILDWKVNSGSLPQDNPARKYMTMYRLWQSIDDHVTKYNMKIENMVYTEAEEVP